MIKPVNVLVVDDCATARQLLTYLINQTPDMQVIGEARNGREAVEQTRKLRPQVILMDITMPHMDGLEATRIIMQNTPTPIVITSAQIAGREAEVAFQALRWGALTVLAKPVAPRTLEQQTQVDGWLGTLRAMAGVRVIRHHWNRPDTVVAKPLPVELPTVTAIPLIVGIVSSTGGPAALCEILRHLPHTYGLPIVVAQHIAADFLPSLVDWLAAMTKLRVKIAEQNEIPQPGTVYFATGQAHLTVTKRRRLDCTHSQPARYIPCGDVLLESLALHYRAQAIGVVLTGMGNDGALGLYRMRQAGAITIAQDEPTSVIFGMPGEATRMNAAQQVLPLPDIPSVLIQLSGGSGNEDASQRPQD